MQSFSRKKKQWNADMCRAFSSSIRLNLHALHLDGCRWALDNTILCQELAWGIPNLRSLCVYDDGDEITTSLDEVVCQLATYCRSLQHVYVDSKNPLMSSIGLNALARTMWVSYIGLEIRHSRDLLVELFKQLPHRGSSQREVCLGSLNRRGNVFSQFLLYLQASPTNKLETIRLRLYAAVQLENCLHGWSEQDVQDLVHDIRIKHGTVILRLDVYGSAGEHGDIQVGGLEVHINITNGKCLCRNFPYAYRIKWISCMK